MECNNNDVKVDANYWKKCYDTNYTRWQEADVNRTLAKYIKLLEKRTPSRFLVPLCGKSFDLKWLYERGHEVIGVDIVEDTILEQFQKILNIPYKVIKVSDALTIYESNDEKVKIFFCDFLKFDGYNYNGTIDCVWDRASIVALNAEERRAYVSVIKKLVKPTFSYLLQSITYDECLTKPPPFNVTREAIDDYFSDVCDIKYLESEAATSFNFPAQFDAYYMSSK